METSLEEYIKSVNSKANNKSPGDDGIEAEFYKHFSNELVPVPLDVYESRGKLGTMGVTSRTGIISVKYKKGDIKILQTTDPYIILKARLKKSFRYYNR